MNSLAEGNHTLKVTYTDGGDATTKFTVASANPKNNNPKTGDNVVFYVVTSILSLLGVAGAGAFVIRRKQTN